MSLWELRCLAEGYRKANGGEEQMQPPTDAEDEALRLKYEDF